MSVGFRGIYAALLTPYDRDGRINGKELKRFVRHLIGQGIDGFYVGGSTGEAFLLSSEERKYCLECVLEECCGERKVIAHVGHISTDVAVDLAKHAGACKADAVSAISPFYYHFTVEEVLRYYLDIMSQSDMPMIIYNFPKLSGFAMNNDQIGRLAEEKNLAGVKFTDTDFFQLERMKRAYPQLAILNGYDEMLLSGLIAGADGGIGSTYNCICKLIKTVYESFMSGQMDAARDAQHKVNDIVSVIARHGGLSSEKYLLELQGFDFGVCRRPFLPLPDAAKAELRKVYDQHIAQY